MNKPSLAFVSGATSGIGLALCKLLAQQGIALMATARNEDALKQLKETLQSLVDVDIVAADLSQSNDRKQLVAWIQKKAPDLVINNAGFGLYGEALSYATSEQEKILTVDGLSVLELTLEAARTLFSKGKKGTILNVSSAAAFCISPQFAVYAASKAFVNHFSQSFDEEMHPYGIRVLATCPGMVQTNFQQRAGGKGLIKEEPGVMSSEFVASQIWQQIQCQKPLLIVDWKYRFLTTLAALLPKHWVATFMKRKMSKRMIPRTMIKINS